MENKKVESHIFDTRQEQRSQTLQRRQTAPSNWSNHNHSLDEVDVFHGDFLMKKVKVIVEELKQQRESTGIAKDEYLEENTEDTFNSSRTDETTNDITFESLEALNPSSKNVVNTREIQIDALWRSLAYCLVEKGDIVNPETEGKPSSQFCTEVLFNIRDYEPAEKSKMKTRRLILEVAKQLEKELMEDYFNHVIAKEKSSEDIEITADEVDLNESRAEHTSFDNVKTGTLESQIRYKKLNRVSENISPYRIYEIPDDWDEDEDGSPIVVLEEFMPIFSMEKCIFSDDEKDSENDSPQKVVKNEPKVESKEADKKQDPPSETESEHEDEKGLNLDDEKSSTDDENTLKIPTDLESKHMLNSVNIDEEINEEIENDLSGVDIKAPTLKERGVKLNYLKKDSLSGIKRNSLSMTDSKIEDSDEESSSTLYVNEYLYSKPGQNNEKSKPKTDFKRQKLSDDEAKDMKDISDDDESD